MKANKEGFTLIELIVVIAVIGILVLLGGNRFLGQISKAKMVNIQNDIKVLEGLIEYELIDNHQFLDDWEIISNDQLSAQVEAGKLYDKRGLANEFDVDDYRIVNSKFVSKSAKSRLPGKFVANASGGVLLIKSYQAQDLLNFLELQILL